MYLPEKNLPKQVKSTAINSNFFWFFWEHQLKEINQPKKHIPPKWFHNCFLGLIDISYYTYYIFNCLSLYGITWFFTSICPCDGSKNGSPSPTGLASRILDSTSCLSRSEKKRRQRNRPMGNILLFLFGHKNVSCRILRMLFFFDFFLGVEMWLFVLFVKTLGNQRSKIVENLARKTIYLNNCGSFISEKRCELQYFSEKST